ncbi:amidohydrolase [Thermoflavimicrobium dichotomicum]|uniref:Amidohydrolase 3 domain-containing protein n=1 Tax=Thermoflavimicrobium dichotomicum TaxID=46223 RepID=A0A1I3MGG0_9BACL|nr:amidohydrolase [Thermoflavimicrobium dichotomicum]SFI96053.1 hypothetical protein SAMN05421852_10359 [Thermoflavimicrobium dichotomicum]
MEKAIFYGGQIITLDPDHPQVEAVYVENGRIVAMGDKADLLLQAGRTGVTKFDLQGSYMYPGFADSHMHLSLLGEKLRKLDLGLYHSKGELLQAIRERVARAKTGEWILGSGWDEKNMVGGMPTLAELDEVAPCHPVFLTRICHHVHLANSQAWKQAQPYVQQASTSAGALGKDESGKWNGWVYENASQSFFEAQPKPTYDEKKETIRTAMKTALACGLTAVHTEDLRYIGSVSEMKRIFYELVEEGVYLRTHHLLYHPFLPEIEKLNEAFRAGNEWITLGAIKIFADGSLGGRTAWLSQPYADAPDQYGLAIHEPEELKELVSQAAHRGFPVAVHAIGDKAAEQTIQAMYANRMSEKKKRLRHRLIHGQILRPELIQQLQAMKIVVDIQPRFVVSDFPWVLERIGEERARYAYAWKTLLEAGIPCAAGSDAPIEPIEPLWGMHAAMTRKHPEDQGEHLGYFPEQKLTAIEALLLFTKGSAYAAEEEHERGSISIGKWADFSVFDRDILSAPANELLEAQTLMTVVNGQIAYQRS